MKLSEIDSLYVYLCTFVFQLINIIDEVTAAILLEKRAPCYCQSFDPIFLKID